MSTLAERGMAAGWNIQLVMVDGVVEAEDFADKLETMKSRPLREDDIFLATYPKSGTHWAWEILNMIVAGKAEYAKHWQNSALLELRTEEELEKLTSPRIFHTHLLPRQMPELLWQLGCKVVYVERNAKDCAVSSFCQVSQQVWEGGSPQQSTFTGSWDDFLSVYQDGCAPFGSIFDHVNEWKNVSDVYDGFEVCSVKYEDMKQDCATEIKRMAEYLDRHLPEEKYQQIAEACSFKNLKHASEKIKDQTFHVAWQEGSSGYFRKGQAGDWKNWFTVAQSEEFDRKYELKCRESAIKDPLC
ncbi:sulfotransferase 1 family member D1-like [Haliotis cracherodii]|uniref:sulfotransferase 1 family member D1-like n=1 Tax=Haliotis cracherodii TaxID=6455 RepID=UPI0039E968F7